MNLLLSIPAQRYYRIAVSIFYFIQGTIFATWASRIPDIQAETAPERRRFGSRIVYLACEAANRHDAFGIPGKPLRQQDNALYRSFALSLCLAVVGGSGPAMATHVLHYSFSVSAAT